MGQTSTSPYFQDDSDPEDVQRRQEEQQLMAAQTVLGGVAPVSSMADYAVAPSPVAAGAIASAPPTPPRPTQYQTLNQQLQDKLAQKPSILRNVAALGTEFFLGRRAPQAAEALSQQILRPGVSSLAQRVQLAKQAQDEDLAQKRLQALTDYRTGQQQAMAQNRQVQQSSALRRGGMRPIASAPTPLPPIPSGDQGPQTVQPESAPSPIGQIPTPPQLIGGAQQIPQPIGQIPAPSTRLATATQVMDPLTKVPGQIPTPEDQDAMKKQAEAEQARAAYEEQLKQRGIATPDAIKKAVPGVPDKILPEELAKYAPLVKTEQSATEKNLGDRVPQFNKVLAQRYQVLHPGQPLPSEYMLPPNATQKDYEEIQKALGGTETAEGVKTQREQARATAEGNRENKQDTSLKQSVYKTYTPAMDSAERFNVMAKNYENAIKNHDQQAMLSLLANHLGMTMGLQKGSRLTRDIIKEAQQSRPWLQGLAAKFDNQGYLSGVTLTPEQMRQMVDLGRERFTEDITKARNEASYLGAKDDGPKRTPNKAAINHYTALANGDPQKAKQLAAADGWSVQ